MTDICKPIEDAVLAVLPGGNPAFDCGDDFYFPLAMIAARAGIDKETARFGCRRLRDKGLARYARGLLTEDGVGGAGYALTPDGRAALLVLEGDQ